MTSASEEELRQLKVDYDACLLSHWKLCAVGIALGMPASLRYKVYWPFAVGGMVGTALDHAHGKAECRPLHDKLVAARLAAAGGGGATGA